MLKTLENYQPGQRIEVAQMKIQSFRGKIPDVETYKGEDGVNTELLYKGDPDPFHITLAILAVDEISENGILYDEELVTSIENQLKGEGGIRGHLGWFDSNKYPYTEVDWIGHLRDATGVTWAKGYIPPGLNREETRRRMATNGKIGTSIYGFAEDIDEVEDGVFRLIGFDLITLDMVHPKMASLKMGLWSGFKITSESAKEDAIPLREAIQKYKTVKSQPEAKKETSMPAEIKEEKTAPDLTAQLERVAEMEREHARKIQELEAQITALKATETDYTELCAVLENSDDPKTVVVGLQSRVAELTKENGELLKDSIEKMVKEAVKIEFVRPVVIELVNSHKPVTREDAAKAVEAVVAQEYVKALLMTETGRQMGPKQERPVTPVSENDKTLSVDDSVLIPA